jgi:outer membrane autotransporter protein
MKKVLVTLALYMGLIGTASAVTLGVNGGVMTGGNDGGIAGVTVGEKWGKIGVDAGFSRGWGQDTTSDRWTLVAGYDVARVAGVTVTPKIGYAYLDNSNTIIAKATPSASAGLVGVGASLPITKKISATADYAYQFSGSSNNNANVITAGLKYKF